MKYPQLVSTKAVNEISDWLIKRLEDLDIEHPGVYSRLLLSLLLHTPSKVNAIDLLEDLKEPYRFTNKNNEELKRLAAVQSLMEVSAEENKSSIVSLVDELHSKLRKFESSCEDNSYLMSNSRAAANSMSSASSPNRNNKNLKKIKRNHGVENPTKNYYLAFPALSGNKKMTTTTAAAIITNDQKQPLFGEDVEGKKSNLLSWSNLMSSKKDTSIVAGDNEKGCKVKTPTSRRKRRYGKVYNKGFPKKNDVQFTTKSFTMYDNNAAFSPKKMVKNSNRKQHQRNQYEASTKTINSNSSKNRNNNFSNAQNAPKMDDLTTGSSGAPWDMDFRGHWEMDRDLIKEFIQQQQKDQPYDNDYSRKKDDKMMIRNLQEHVVSSSTGFSTAAEDDAMLMKCLPTKLMIDESLVDDTLNRERGEEERLKKPCNSKETLSLSSLKSKFDENVKALWSDVDVVDSSSLKPLTHKQHFEDDASLASSFTSEKNSLSLFNFAEQQTHHFEVNAPPCTEIYQHQFYKNIDYDCNNNNPMVFHTNGGRGVMSKSSSFNTSPRLSSYSSDHMTKSDFIKSGTNLQTSIWSEGDFNSDAESLIFKEVADPKSTSTDAIYKDLSSIGAEMKQHWETAASAVVQDNNNDVTLFNHSEKSAFKKFRPLVTTTIIRANYHPLNVDYSERSVIPTSNNEQSSESAENYLTSEKTHFSPIIRDGHTFVIDNNWDEIQYERSSSGGITYKSKRYKVWNNNSKLPNINSDIDIVEMENESSEFIIKYMLNENDKACQTNECDFIRTATTAVIAKNRSFMEISEEYCKQKIYDEYFKGITDTSAESRNKWRYVNNADDSNDYSFFSVNRVKNSNNNSNLTTQTFQDILLSSNSSSSSICTITSSQYDASESWRNLKLENNNNNSTIINNNNTNAIVDSDFKQTCMHRLWEQCLTCTQLNEDPYADKSLPANRLMKDELQLDGDEIMNVIQNLYITSDYCDEEEKDDCEEFDMNHVYMNMIMDDSMDGTCTLEEENKFYDSNVDAKNHKNLASTKTGHHRKDVMNLENFDEMTLTQWQWNGKKLDDNIGKDHEKYLKLLEWVKASLAKNSFSQIDNRNFTADTNNNDCQSLSEVHRPKNRKRRHSTCQNFLENKRYHSHEEGFTYHFNFDNSTPPSFLEDHTNLFFDASKMLKLNIEKILLIHADPCFDSGTFFKDPTSASAAAHYKEIGGANYYRNILQQQHALIKQLDLSRPLTR